MADDLVKRLRTCSKEDRKVAALELARSRSNRAIKELIRMVKGGYRHWWRRYEYEDQLIGIEALGATGSRIALEYLKELIGTTDFSQSYTENWQGDSCQINVTGKMTFPRAKRRLAQELGSGEVNIGHGYGPGTFSHP